MNVSKRVSIVVPVYNGTATITACLESFAAQTYPGLHMEVFIVDDGSTDGTPEFVEQLVGQWDEAKPRVTVLRQAHQGPAAARNRGAAAATGEFVLFTDADCVAERDWVEQMVLPFQSPEVAAVKGAYKTRQRSLVARFAQAEFDARYRLLAAARYVDVVFSYSAGFRRELFIGIGGFDTSFPVADNEDTELSYRVAAAGHRIVFNPRAIIYHRHPATLGQYLRKKHSRAYWRMMVYKRFPSKAVKDSYTPQSLKVQIAAIYLALTGAMLLPVTVGGAYVVMMAGVLFVGTALPFVWQLPNGEVALKLVSPFLLLCRATVMASGLLRAMPRLLNSVVS
jgi:cellulose synthase/poly-beta-1,6-N-acetylglucosamine synthase-like glycosyltransferase